MKVRLPALFQDTEQPTLKSGALAQGIELVDHYFLDGPVGRRVAILDFDPDTGALHPGARLRPADGRIIRAYDISERDYRTPEYRAVMVFGTVMKTILQFEHETILGREVRWAFPGQQLLVVPRAGRWRNAFYHRESHSLQFFFFAHMGAEIHLALSEDIVAHETGHAVLDGIAPGLHDAVTPQALAIHESVADLTALTRAMRNEDLRTEILSDPAWSIRQTNQFTALAEEFGRAVSESRTSYLRNAWNQKSLDVNAGLERVDPTRPHDLSQVLTGALYAVLVADYERLEAENLAAGMERIPARGKALGTAASRFERFVFRALDYLPPGEATFADFVRAVLAADLAAYREAEHDEYRKVLRDEAVKRQIVLDASELEVDVDLEAEALADPATTLDALVESDWYAHEFVSRHGPELIGLREGQPFEIRPRLEVTRTYSRSASDDVAHEIILEVTWEQTEPNPIARWLPDQRDVTMGTTLVIDRDRRRIRARLRTDQSARRLAERDAFLRALIDEDRLVAPRPERDGAAVRHDAADAQARLVPSVRSGRMRLHGVARMLHVAADVRET